MENQVENYLEATTLHGFAYLQSSYSACVRIFWSIAVLAGFFLAAFFLQGQLSEWEKNQTITTLQSIATPIQKVQFPTVTVSTYRVFQLDMLHFKRLLGHQKSTFKS